MFSFLAVLLLLLLLLLLSLLLLLLLSLLFMLNSRAPVCHVTLVRRIRMSLTIDQHTCLIAQTFPYFDQVFLRNKCVLTCGGQKDGLGGILAFGAKRLSIDQTSKIEMSGKGK